jgi:CheY-like chemotaxis protein
VTTEGENAEELRLIAVTGYGQDEDTRRSKAAGFDRHLVKPIGRAALRKLLAELSERFRPEPA